VPSSLGRQKYTGRLGGDGVEVVVGMADGVYELRIDRFDGYNVRCERFAKWRYG
jgi:hypothetical protein